MIFTDELNSELRDLDRLGPNGRRARERITDTLVEIQAEITARVLAERKTVYLRPSGNLANFGAPAPSARP